MIISNTSPIILLGKTGNLNLLKQLFKKILIPQAVLDEVSRKESVETFALRQAIKEGWIIVIKVKQNYGLNQLSMIHPGETEAILQALDEKSNVLLDDRIAKTLAKNLGVVVHGTLYVVLLAYKNKIISRTKAIRLVDEIVDAGLYLSLDVYKVFLNLLEKN
jgi:uncharacterized protein